MLSRNKIQYLLSLKRKKVRDEEKFFTIEGDKIVREYILSGNPVKTLIAKPEFISGIAPPVLAKVDEVIPVSYEELKKVSSLTTPHNAMAVAPIPERIFNSAGVFEKVSLALDFIQDPGNLGTIIRAASWFGIKDIVCSDNCVDVYNPKVIQATMGAFINTRVHYHDLKEFLWKAIESGVPVYGTLLEGESLYEAQLEKKGVIILGNESRGISDDLSALVTKKIMIPKYASAETGIDSLNAAMAASIVLSEFARRKILQ